MKDDSVVNLALNRTIETTRRNENTPNKILGGLIVLTSMQACAIGIVSWLLMSTIDNTKNIIVLNESLKHFKVEVDSIKHSLRMRGTMKSSILKNIGYTSILGHSVVGIAVISHIPDSNSGLWIEMQKPNDVWLEKLPSGGRVKYVNEDR